jgi:hypothetical protein
LRYVLFAPLRDAQFAVTSPPHRLPAASAPI